MVKISAEADSFLSSTRVAVISTVDQKGLPHSVPIWYQWTNGTALMFTGVKTSKWKNLSQFPFASLCVDLRTPPYKAMIIHGSVEKVSMPIHDFVLNMANRYYGSEKGHRFADQYPDGKKDVVIFKLIPNTIIEALEED